MMCRFIVFIFSLFCAYSALAQSADPDKLDNLSQQQRKAEIKAATLTSKQIAIQQEIDDLQNGLVSASARSRGYEFRARQIHENLVTLNSEEQALKLTIFKDKAALANLLAALQRIENNPPPSILVSTASVVDTVRAARLMKALSISLNIKSEELAMRLSDLNIVRAKMLTTQTKLSENSREIDKHLRNIKLNISKKSKLNFSLNIEKKAQEEKAKNLAAEAKNLRELIAKFEKQAKAIHPRLKPKLQDAHPSIPSPVIKPKIGDYPPPFYTSNQFRRFADARGKLSLPVLGTVSRKYGAKLKDGSHAKGLYLHTLQKAQVVAPFAGRIEFSGLFNNITVIILNVGNGYFIVLTGLASTYAAAGDTVKAGEPIGLMPSGGGSKPELFMEFRKNKTSIDPTPWVGPALKL